MANSIKDIGGTDAKFISIDQGDPKGLGHAIGCAEDSIDDDEYFAVILADDLIFNKGNNVLKQMKEAAIKTNKQVLALEKVNQEDISKFGVVSTKSTNERISYLDDIVEKPDADKAPSNLAVVGRYIFNKSIFSYIDEHNAGKNNEIQITDAIQKDIDNFIGYEFEGERFDCGSKVGYLKANLSYKFGILSFIFRKPNDENCSFAGMDLSNRLGTAAGLDKNGKLIKELDNLGFGFVEIGTVTPRPQMGNKKPRIHRLIKENSLLNSLGFPNEGLDAIKKRLKNTDKITSIGTFI